MKNDFWNFVRSQIIGRHQALDTPFGERALTYADYTASGRGVLFLERYMERILAEYGNTHTEDDATGGISTDRLHRAEHSIKRLVNAGPDHLIIESGTGSTGAVHRLQQILGVYVPPAAKELVRRLLEEDRSPDELSDLERKLRERLPVVFVGPYEHHSNEISWRECLAETVEVDLDGDGLLDLADLERKVSDPRYRNRIRIGSFSAASNVTGIKTPVYDVARLLHRHGAFAFFDFAACAPYEPIDMNRDDEAFFDGLFFSPHKLLGGPGSTGILIFHRRLYREGLPPTHAAGGTVDYVGFSGQQYTADIESREKPGTPGILQTMRVALALELKEKLGVERIQETEEGYIRRAMERFSGIPGISVVGNPDPAKRIAILSFNIRSGTEWLHPRFVVRLLNDLFGIQARAGCSCAGPYGHRLLGIGPEQSLVYQERIVNGQAGLKPGWVRMNFHFLIPEEEFRLPAGRRGVRGAERPFLPAEVPVRRGQRQLDLPGRPAARSRIRARSRARALERRLPGRGGA